MLDVNMPSTHIAGMNARILCLGLLNTCAMSGYEIRKLVAEGTVAHFAEASYGSIYPALDRLEADGLVTSREERAPGKPPRRIYEITETGRAAFVEAIHEMPGPDVYRSPFLLVAASAPLVRREHLVRVVDARLAWARGELARMEAERADAVARGDDELEAGWLWTLDYGLEMFRTSIAFMERNRARLEALAVDEKRERVAPVRPGRTAPAAPGARS
jgi:DNA-binding PadR family transcriptional regulator